jgi:glutathione S-transferase
VKAKIYVIPGSHPSLAGRLMLEHKGIEYRRVDLVSALHKPLLKAMRFPGNTVPAIKLDGRRIQGTREISRTLDEIQPEPPLFPADPDRRRAVEEAERWGDEVLQSVPRRLTWWSLRRDMSTIRTFLEGARLGVPVGLAARTAGPIAWMSARFNKANDESVRADLAALPRMLDQVDAYIAEGVIGGQELNAADYQIATSVRLLMCLEDVAPFIERRPAGELARRVAPEFPGRVPPVAPPAWLEPLRAAAPSPA